MHLKAGLIREWERLQVVDAQLWAVEREIRAPIKGEEKFAPVSALLALPGVGRVGAWTLVLKIFAWRAIANRRELTSLAGQVPAPGNSGSMVRDQGISKAGNRRARALLI